VDPARRVALQRGETLDGIRGDTTTNTRTGTHATDQLLVLTTPYYAHLYPLLLRARGALQDLDRSPQEL
jgi:hypothetical protein